MATDITKKKREAQLLKDEPILSDIYNRLPQRFVDEKSIIALQEWYEAWMSDWQACAKAWIKLSTWKDFISKNKEIEEWVTQLKEISVGKATSVINRLMDSKDEKIAFDSAKFIKTNLDERFQKKDSDTKTIYNVHQMLQMNADKPIPLQGNNLVNTLRNI